MVRGSNLPTVFWCLSILYLGKGDAQQQQPLRKLGRGLEQILAILMIIVFIYILIFTKLYLLS